MIVSGWGNHTNEDFGLWWAKLKLRQKANMTFRQR